MLARIAADRCATASYRAIRSSARCTAGRFRSRPERCCAPEVCVRVETYPVRVIDGTIAVQLPSAKKSLQEEEKAA